MAWVEQDFKTIFAGKYGKISPNWQGQAFDRGPEH